MFTEEFANRESKRLIEIIHKHQSKHNSLFEELRQHLQNPPKLESSNDILDLTKLTEINHYSICGAKFVEQIIKNKEEISNINAILNYLNYIDASYTIAEYIQELKTSGLLEQSVQMVSRNIEPPTIIVQGINMDDTANK